MVWSDRVRFPVSLFDDKNIMEYLFIQKTRNLTRIPIFAMIGGVRMCDLCKYIGIGIPDWDFLTPDKNGKVPSGNKIEIRKIADKHALVFTNSAGEYGAGAINIAFCPICGRKLV